MKKTITVTILLICILSTGFIIKPETSNPGISKENKEGFCRLEGSYILESPRGATTYYALGMAIPLDEKNSRVALISDVANFDVTFGGLLPTAVRSTTGQGEAVRTGPNTFNYTVYFWGLDRNNQRVSIHVSSGTIVIRERDCNRYETSGGMLSVFLLTQDADNDGFPDEGQLPKYCIPLSCKAKRVSVVPPCKP